MAPVCKRWRRLAILSWKSLKRLSFENMFKSIFRAGKHGELWCSVCRERVKGGRGEGKGKGNGSICIQ